MKKAVEQLYRGVLLQYANLQNSFTLSANTLDYLVKQLYNHSVLTDKRFDYADLMNYLYENANELFAKVSDINGIVQLNSTAFRVLLKTDYLDQFENKELIRLVLRALEEYKKLENLQDFFKHSSFCTKAKPKRINFCYQYNTAGMPRKRMVVAGDIDLETMYLLEEPGCYVFVPAYDIICEELAKQYNITLPTDSSYFFKGLSKEDDKFIATDVLTLKIKGDTEFAERLWEDFRDDYIMNMEASFLNTKITKLDNLYMSLMTKICDRQNEFREKYSNSAIAWVCPAGVLYRTTVQDIEYDIDYIESSNIQGTTIDYLTGEKIGTKFSGEYLLSDYAFLSDDLIYYKINKNIYYNKYTPYHITKDNSVYILTDLV